jgi:hypothetical protein
MEVVSEVMRAKRSFLTSVLVGYQMAWQSHLRETTNDIVNLTHEYIFKLI